jgi:hypothetical protein
MFESMRSDFLICEKSTEERDPAATGKRMGTLPTNQRAPEREERLVDLGPIVIQQAQTAKLIPDDFDDLRGLSRVNLLSSLATSD